MHKKDGAWQKTHRHIQDCFLKLLKKEETFKKVSVSQLIKRAQINRSTFYAHFLDKYDVMEQIENQFLEQMTELLDEDSEAFITQNFDKESPLILAHTRKVTHFFRKNAELLELFLQNEADTNFFNKLQDQLGQFWQEKDINQEHSIPQNYLLKGVLSLLVGLIQEWIATGFAESEEEFNQIIFTFFSNLSLSPDLRKNRA